MKDFPNSRIYKAGPPSRTGHNIQSTMATFLWITVNRYLHQTRITCAEIAYSQVFHFRKKLKTVGSYRSLRPNLLSTRDAPKWILHHQFLKEIENLKTPSRIWTCIAAYTGSMLTVTPLKYELPHSTGYASPQFHPRFSILEADKP